MIISSKILAKLRELFHAKNLLLILKISLHFNKFMKDFLVKILSLKMQKMKISTTILKKVIKIKMQVAMEMRKMTIMAKINLNNFKR